MNWVDYLVLFFLGLSVLAGFREGFIRLGIGFIALVVGFLAATWMYGLAADPVMPYVHSRMFANFIGFNVIFFSVLFAGAVLAGIIARAFKLVGLSFFDRMLGALFGGIRGALVVTVATMCIMAFAPGAIPAKFRTSRSGPYIITASRYLSSVAPYELKNAIQRTVRVIPRYE